MKSSLTAIAAVLAAASFAGSALADGDYYEGASKDSNAAVSTQTNTTVDTLSTGSIEKVRVYGNDVGNGGPIFKHESRDNR